MDSLFSHDHEMYDQLEQLGAEVMKNAHSILAIGLSLSILKELR